MATPKDKAIPSTASPEEGIEQTTASDEQVEQSNGNLSSSAIHAPSDGDDSASDRPESHAPSVPVNGLANGYSPQTDKAGAEHEMVEPDAVLETAVDAGGDDDHGKSNDEIDDEIDSHALTAEVDSAEPDTPEHVDVELEDDQAVDDDVRAVTSDDFAKRPNVKIKGRPDGVVIEIGVGEWADLFDVLEDRLATADGFFRGGKAVLDTGEHVLDKSQLRNVCNLLEAHDMQLDVVHGTSKRTLQAATAVGLIARLPEEAENDEDDVSGDEATVALPPSRRSPSNPLPRNPLLPNRPRNRSASLELDGINEAKSTPKKKPTASPRPTGHFVYRGSLRSGQVLRKAESIVVLGDVNPGAQVISSGDVIVWGRLRGLANAGVDGNRKAVVAALDFAPTQLRIASLTAIAPEPKRSRRFFFWRKEPANRPEIARVIDDGIVVEPWDEAKIGKFSNW